MYMINMYDETIPVRDMIKEVIFEECETAYDALYCLYRDMGVYLINFGDLDITSEIFESGSISIPVIDEDNLWVNLEYEITNYNDRDYLNSEVKNIKIDLI